MCSSWKSFSFSSPNFFDGEISDSITQEAKAKNLGLKKTSVIQGHLKSFFKSTNVICSDIALRRDLTVYITYWLGDAVFAGGDGTHIRPH